MKLNYPNVLTLLRVLLIPIFVIIFYLNFKYSSQIAAFIFIIAGCTDWLDGYLARKLNQVTRFGEFCDPIADKLIVVIALLLLIESYSSFIITIPAIVIVGRELVISGLREWMAKVGHAHLVSVVYLGKVKTLFQMMAISMLLYKAPLFSIDLASFGTLLLVIAAVLTLITMIQYIYWAWPKLKDAH